VPIQHLKGCIGYLTMYENNEETSRGRVMGRLHW
jgi:hypothetical protein